jgi:alpha-glucosidase
MHDAQNLFDAKLPMQMNGWRKKLDSINAQLIVIGIEHGNENEWKNWLLKMKK